MILIKTYLDKSPITGIGVFADEPVKKGTLIWEFNPMIDVILNQEQVNQLPELTKEFVKKNAHPYPEDAPNYCLSYDNANHLNHSFEPNVSALEPTIALKDIPKGDELTVNYLQLEKIVRKAKSEELKESRKKGD